MFCCPMVALANLSPSDMLRQKIEIARRLADEAASGKAESGRVIENNFDFVAELKKYRDSLRAEKSEEVLTEDSEEDSLEEDPDLLVMPQTSVAEKPLEKSKPKVKYAVDTSKDFVKGYYLGNVDGDAREERKREILDNIENAKKSVEKKYFSYSGALFEIVSDNYSAHTTMIYAIGEFEKIAKVFFSRKNSNLTFGKKIWLKVSDDYKNDVSQRTLLSASSTGDLSLYVSWSKDLNIEEFCFAASEALLLKIAYESGGNFDAKNIPMWLKMAFAVVLENSIRFGTVSDFAIIASKNPPPDILSVFSKKSYDKISSANSYWTLVAIEKVIKDRDALSHLLRSACRGDSPESLAKRIAIYNYKSATIDFDVWWRCVLTGEIWARMGGVLSPNRSAEEIARLAVLSVDDNKGGREGVSVSKVLEKSEMYKDDIRLRILEIKVALSVINPLYHNALVCLGEMYESALDNDEEDFNSAKTRFAESFNNARVLSRETYNMLKN